MARLARLLLVAISAVILANPPAHAGGSADLNGDGHVDNLDLALLLGEWGPVPCSTTVVGIFGNIDVSVTDMPSGSVHEMRAFYTDALLTPGMELTGAEDLSLPGTNLYIHDGAGGVFLALEGGADAIVTVSGVTKGGYGNLGEASFAFSTDPTVIATTDDHGTTMADFLDFLDAYLGLDRPVPPPADPNHWLGAVTSINASGQIVIHGNEGTVQDLDFETADLLVTYAGLPVGSPLWQPFVLTKTGTATGESRRTAFRLFDSLCNWFYVSISVILQSPTLSGPTAIWIAESRDTAGLDRLLGLGVISFDNFGQYSMASNTAFTVTRDNGAVSPLTVNFDFDLPAKQLTALGNSPSWLSAFSTTHPGTSAADLDGDGQVGITDFLILLASWG